LLFFYRSSHSLDLHSFPTRRSSDLVNEVADIASAVARTNAPATEKLDQLLTAVHHRNKMMLVKARPMHELIVAATQQNWPIIKAHIERMVTIFEAIIREGVEAGEFDVDDATEAARAVRSAFMPFFHPGSDRALRSTRRRHQSSPARPDPLYPESSR